MTHDASLTLGAGIQASIERHADRPALVASDGSESLSYAALGSRLAAISRLLAAEGIRAGDIVTIMSPNSLDSTVLMLGAMIHGAIVNPLNPALTPAEIATLLAHAGSRLMFVTSDRSPPELPAVRLRAIPGAAALGPAPTCSTSGLWHLPARPGPPAPRDGALLIYTSGTTGHPKGVLLSHHNLVFNMQTAIGHLGLRPGHVTLCILPLFHTFALVSDLGAALLCGGTAVVAPIFDITRLRALEQAVFVHGVQSFSAVPLMFDLMLRLGMSIRGGALRFCVSGAAPLRPETQAGFQARYGVPIIAAYGMTETTCFATISPPGAPLPGSCGVPAGCQVRIVGDAGEDLRPGEIGELVIAGDSVMHGGYFRDPRPAYLDDAGRWLRTGDLGRRDAAGAIYLTGRKKNMVIRGGEKVYLEDLDHAIAALPGVLDSATVGIDDGQRETIVTFVVRAAGASLDEPAVFRYLRDRVGDSRCADAVRFCDAIPRTVTSKVRIAELQRIARSMP